MYQGSAELHGHVERSCLRGGGQGRCSACFGGCQRGHQVHWQNLIILCNAGTEGHTCGNDLETLTLNTQKGSSATDGGIERANYEVGKLRALRSRYEQVNGEAVESDHTVLPFVVCHPASLTPYRLDQADGKTLHDRLRGRFYGHIAVHGPWRFALPSGTPTLENAQNSTHF